MAHTKRLVFTIKNMEIFLETKCLDLNFFSNFKQFYPENLLNTIRLLVAL